MKSNQLNKKILLVKPPETSPHFNFGTYSLAVLAASIRHLGEVSIVDATNLSVNDAANEVWSSKPDLTGITVMGYESVPFCEEFIRCLESRRPEKSGNEWQSLVVAGGHGATTFPEKLLVAGADAVVLGEGELTFQEIIKSGVQPGMPGTAILDGHGNMISGPTRSPISKLDELPVPARDLVEMPEDGVHLLETSRGCPHDCAFCASTRFYGRHWRPYSPQRVVAEIQTLVNDYGAWIILIADDNFTANPKRILRICKMLEGQDLPAIFMVAARGDDLISSPEILPAMAKANMLRVCVGVESLDPETAKAAGKPVPADTYKQLFDTMRQLGMFSMASMIVGLPGESEQARSRTVECLVECAPDSAQFNPFLPIPGTPLGIDSTSIQPTPAARQAANDFQKEFYNHARIREQLKRSASDNGIRGILARGVLKNASLQKN